MAVRANPTDPSPAPHPSGVAGRLSGLLPAAVAPSGGGGGGKDPYSLGQFSTSALVPNLPFPIQTDSSGHATAQQIIEAFAHASPGAIAELQTKLYQAGAYSGTYNPMLHPGLIRPEDLAAFASTVKVAAQQSTPETPMNLGDYLQASASFGAQTGKAAASMNFGTDTHVVTHQNRNMLNLTADSVAQQVLGRKADAGERARFAAFFDKTDIGRQMAVYNAQDASIAANYQRQLDQAGGDATTPDAAGNAARPAITPFSISEDPASQGPAPASQGVDQFAQAIGGQESGGAADPYALKANSAGAEGKYQVVASNWPTWAREAGLGPAAAKTPANQERVAKFKMQQYYNQLGSWDAVAVAWYAGPGAAQEWLKNPQASRFTRKQTSGHSTYPSINDYVSQVSARMGSTGVLAPTATPAPYGVDQPNIPISQRVDVTDTNPAADAEAFFRKEHPVEAGAKDVANTFDVFTKLIGNR